MAILESDIEAIDKYRKEYGLLKPSEFDNGRLDSVMMEKLLPMLRLPFQEKAIEENNTSGFKAKGINTGLQEARLHEVFGCSHVKIEHTVVEKKFEDSSLKELEEDNETDINAQDNRKQKKGMYYYKVYVTLMLGNWSYFVNSDNKPDSNFVIYYKTEGIGFGGGVDDGKAEKNALANGKKEAFRNMGMLRYLYTEDDDNEGKAVPTGEQTTIELIEIPTFPQSGQIFMKCKAKDTIKNKEVGLIVFKENNQNAEEHKKIIRNFTANRALLKVGTSLNITYFKKMFMNEEQYNILSIKNN